MKIKLTQTWLVQTGKEKKIYLAGFTLEAVKVHKRPDSAMVALPNSQGLMPLFKNGFVVVE